MQQMPTTEARPGVTPDAPAVLADHAEEQEVEIDLLELFFHLLENIKYIIVATFAGALILGICSFFLITPKYESTAKLYVLNSSDSVVNLSDLQIGSYLTSDYQEVFKTWEVNEKVISNLALDYTYLELQELLTISNPSNTRILYITAKTNSAAESTRIANEFADVAREYISETMAAEMPNILSTALEPTLPVSPNKTLNIILGALAGAFLAVAILVVRFLLDDRIKSTDDILRYAGLPTLAVVPVLGEQNIQRQQKAAKPRKADKKR